MGQNTFAIWWPRTKSQQKLLWHFTFLTENQVYNCPQLALVIIITQRVYELIIQISWKHRVALTWKLLAESGHNFTHATAAELSWCANLWPDWNKQESKKNFQKIIWVICSLTNWGRDKMAAIFQTTLSNAFSWMNVLEFRLKFHWSLFLRIQLTIFPHWFR